MQSSTASSGPRNYESRRSTPSRATLSSEIVRPVFQRGMGGRDTMEDQHYSPPLRGPKRVFAPERSSSLTPALPPIDTNAFTPTSRTLMSDYQSPEPPVASWYTAQDEAKPSRYLPTDSAYALATAATSILKQAQADDEDAQPHQKRRRIRLKTERRREQCRANQARYRQKQLDHAKTLELTVQKLRADIPVLELQRNRLLYGGQQNVWNIVVEYFHVFRFGVPVAPPVQSAGSVDATTDCLENAEAKQQLAFLRSSMAEDVMLGERSGVDALMDQWRRYSSSFQSVYFQLERIERVNDQFVSVTAVMNVTVVEATLTSVFPHLQGNAEYDEGAGSRFGDGSEARRLMLRPRLVGRDWLCFARFASNGTQRTGVSRVWRRPSTSWHL